MYKVFRSLGLIWTDLRCDRLFLIGIAVKIALISLLFPTIQHDLFVPFIVNWIEGQEMLPWTGHLLSGGDPIAFPYGPAMFLYHLPTTAVGWLIDYSLEVKYFANIGFRLSLLIADMFLLMLLLQIYENHWKRILIYYWLSPLIIFITYWHGQTDIVPMFLFFYGLVFLRRGKFEVAGVMFAISVAAKHSIFIGMPFVFIYMWSHNGIHKEFQRLLLLFIYFFVLIEIPLFFTDAFRIMVLENREVDKLYSLFIHIDEQTLIFFVPIVYLLLLYFFWRIRRVNFDLLIAVMGVGFSVIILMTPSPPGWYLWLVPILAIHQSQQGAGAKMLVGIFSLLFISYNLLYTSGANILLFDYDIYNFESLLTAHMRSIHYTFIVGFGLLITVQLMRSGVHDNDYYKLGYRPLTIGIAGDLGVGKGVFSSGLSKIFGDGSTVEISGYDYNNWDKSSPMWGTLTYLDPKAYQLFQLVKDVRCLIAGGVIKARSYDHITGYFKPAIIKRGSDIIIVRSLHALYPKQLLEELDVRFFIKMDDSLKNYYSNKINMEDEVCVNESNCTENINNKFDTERYIKPQAARADVVFSLLAVNPELQYQYGSTESNFKVSVRIRNGIYYHELVRVLIGICGLQVNMESIDENGEVVLEVGGDLSTDDVCHAIHVLVPHMEDLFDLSAEFAEGVQGIMQIISFMEIDEALKRRK